MKDATGEMSMTVIVIIAVAAVLALFRLVLWPALEDRITKETGNTANTSIDVGTP